MNLEKSAHFEPKVIVVSEEVKQSLLDVSKIAYEKHLKKLREYKPPPGKEEVFVPAYLSVYDTLKEMSIFQSTVMEINTGKKEQLWEYMRQIYKLVNANEITKVSFIVNTVNTVNTDVTTDVTTDVITCFEMRGPSCEIIDILELAKRISNGQYDHIDGNMFPLFNISRFSEKYEHRQFTSRDKSKSTFRSVLRDTSYAARMEVWRK